MSWAGSEPAQIYLGCRSVAVWSPAAAGSSVQWRTCESALTGWEWGAGQLPQVGSLHRRRRVVVWLSGALARPFILEPVQGLRRWSDAQQVASAMAPEATGLAGPCEVWIDAWVPGESCIAIAVDRSVREAVENSACSSNVRLAAIRPWWVAALNEAMTAPNEPISLVAVEEADGLTVLSGHEGRFASASSYVPRSDASQTEALLKRALLAAGATAAQGVHAAMQEHGAGDESSVPFGVRLERLA